MEVNRKRGFARVATRAIAGLLVAAWAVAAGPLAAQDGAGASVEPVGRWALSLEGAFASQTWALRVTREEGTLSATLDFGPMGTAELQDVVLEGDTLRGHFTANMHGQLADVALRSVIAGDGCQGEITGLPMGDIAFTGRREKG